MQRGGKYRVDPWGGHTGSRERGQRRPVVCCSGGMQVTLHLERAGALGKPVGWTHGGDYFGGGRLRICGLGKYIASLQGVSHALGWEVF